MLDVSAASEYSLQVDPASLHINPHVKQTIDTIKAVLPGEGIIFKHLQVYAFRFTIDLHITLYCLQPTYF